MTWISEAIWLKPGKLSGFVASLGAHSPDQLARLGSRHHIAAMIEPPPSPSPVWTLDSDSLDQGPGAPSAPWRRRSARRLFARRQRRRRPRRPERGAHRRAQERPQRRLWLRRHHFLRRSRSHQQPCRPGLADGQSHDARRPRASGARARRRSRHGSCAAQGRSRRLAAGGETRRQRQAQARPDRDRHRQSARLRRDGDRGRRLGARTLAAIAHRPDDRGRGADRRPAQSRAIPAARWCPRRAK